MKKTLWLTITVLFLLLFLVGVFAFYPYIFDKNVYGEMLSVEKVGPQTVISDNAKQASSLAFSYAIAIKEQKTGEIFTASSEDRQFAAISKGYCARVRLYPYPPWNMAKAGTYHDARLLKMSECH
jgi:hypothetical protein